MFKLYRIQIGLKSPKYPQGYNYYHKWTSYHQFMIFFNTKNIYDDKIIKFISYINKSIKL